MSPPTGEQPVEHRRVLFVCGGNTCRSPMATALAHSLSANLQADSAGVDPGDVVQKHAVDVIRELTNVNISDHEPRDVGDVDLQSYDVVVALDDRAAREMSWLLGDGPPTLCTEPVPDPFGGSKEDYRRCAEQIRGVIDRLMTEGVL
jgi:protein arginine phosphatase